MDESQSPTRSQDESIGAGPFEYPDLPGSEIEDYHSKQGHGSYYWDAEAGFYLWTTVGSSTAPPAPFVLQQSPISSTKKDFKIESQKILAELPQACSVQDSNSEKSGKSIPHSIFNSDRQSRTTFPSSTSNQNIKMKALFQPQLDPEAASIDGHAMEDTEQESATEVNVDDNSDAVTAYSVDSYTDDDSISHMQAFIDHISQDIKSLRSHLDLSNLPHPYIDSVLKEFAWKLHEESSNPFQWETSVIIHKKRSEIVALLASEEICSTTEPRKNCDNMSVSNDEEEEEEEQKRPESFKKSRDTILKWTADVSMNAERLEKLTDLNTEIPTSQLPDHERFVYGSIAYQWLLSKICHYSFLECGTPDLMGEIGAKIRHKLRDSTPLQRISRRGPLQLVTMTLHVDWNIFDFFSDRKDKSQTCNILDHVVCLTGLWNNAQSTTVAEYFEQTWPNTGGPILSLLAEILTQPMGKECIYSLPNLNGSQLNARFQLPSSCFITVTGGLYFVSEIAEQIGWVASALRSSPMSQGVVSCWPRLEELNVVTVGKRAAATTTVVGSCSMFFDFTENNELPGNDDGFCWNRLFCNPILASGYPILRRSGSSTEGNTGVEMSLGTMAYLVRSQQVVQWGNRIMIKGFNMLLIATLGSATVLIWHLLVSENADERISYSDSRIDNSSIKLGQKVSLRSLEEMRHVVGWCSKATDHCGQATANLNLETSGLGKPPGSIVIDRLYLEGGSQLVGGLNMRINQKDRPFWLERENDYPSLLRWMGLQPIVFYDVRSRRAWLIDGISALLHLVRASLHRDERDPESPYDWVFKSTDLKDTWDGFKGRLAALKTLKSWDNLNLNLYIKSRSNCEGKDVNEYVTLEERVKKILHSIEIIIDRQVKVSSEDGIKVAQKLDPRRTVVGFDILDVIAPIGPIGTRIQHLDSWGHGWVDLLPSIGVTTIFGNGFGDLIRPDDPDSMCSRWKSLPRGKDYMASSMSTLKMLYEKRFLRLDPTLGVGELTRDILWTSPSGPFESCSCLNANLVGGAHHHNPVQILASRSRKLNLNMGRPRLVDMTKLDEKGAVVFGRSKDGRTDGRSYEERNQDNISIGESNIAQETSSMESSVIQRMASSSIGSSDNQATNSTVLTSPSLESSCEMEIGETSNASSTYRGRFKRIKRKWNNFNI